MPQGNTDEAGTRVWRALCTARKPIIGHNCLYDLLFTYAAVEGALHADEPESALPRAPDTKVDLKELTLEDRERVLRLLNAMRSAGIDKSCKFYQARPAAPARRPRAPARRARGRAG